MGKGLTQWTQGSGSTSALSLLDQAAVSATGFLSGVIVARYATLSELGVYHLAIAVLLFLRGIQTDLITSPFAVYSCQRDTDGLETYTGSILVHQLIALVMALLLLGFLYLALIAGPAPSGLPAAMPALFVAAPMVLMREFLRMYAFARLQITHALVADFMVMLCQLAGLYWIAVTIDVGARHALWAIGGACGIACAGWWLIARPRFKIQMAHIRSDWHLNWGFGRWALTSFLVCNCTPYIMIWLVAGLRSAAETGKFGSCVLLIGLSNLFLIAMHNVLTPIIASRYHREGLRGLGRVWRKATVLFVLVLGCFAALMFGTGDWLGGVVFGPEFSDVGILCGILAVAKLMESLSVVAVKIHWAVDRPEMNLPADITTTLTTIAFALYSVPGEGITGAAVAILVGNAAGAVVRWGTFFKWSQGLQTLDQSIL